jgi:murein DD-endopeptidase MepM/ murein hydrolase activator NlpD
MNSKKIFIPLFLFLMISCGKNPFSPDARFMLENPELTALPVQESSLLWISPFGEIIEGESTRFHDGIDIGTVNLGPFYTCADGIVTMVEIDTGTGWPGTNYRIIIKVSAKLEIEYHFEIGGDIAEQERRNNIFVSKGERVQVGQHIANLINLDQNVAHVHFAVKENGNSEICPMDFFSKAAAQKFEELYDKYARIVDHSLHPDICK